MIGLDSNVLARYIVRDDAAQAAQASRFLQTNCSPGTPGYINCIVLSELAWLLRRGYKYKKADVVKVLRQLLSTRQFLAEDEARAWLALQDYEQGSADYADYLIAQRNQHQGCTQTVTFDRKAAKHPLFQKVS